MGLGIGAVKLYLDLWSQGVFKEVRNVCDIGAQELHLTLADFKELIHGADVHGYKEEDFEVLKNWPGTPRCSAQPFYKLLGIENYTCTDILEYHGAAKLDLNYPLTDKELYNKFDLVTDHGTNEHVFNTGEAYRTMHRLCRPGGVLIIGQMIYGGNGYYLYDPAFFEGMAMANQYEILFSSLCLTTKTNTPNGSPSQYHLPVSRDLLDVLDWGKVSGIGIYYAMRKQTDADFFYPYQGQIFSNIKRCYGYRLLFSQSHLGRSYIPMFSLETIPGKALVKEVLLRLKCKAKKILRNGRG